MDNNNNKRSPLDEIKRITQQATGNRGAAPANQPQKTQPAPISTQPQRPVQPLTSVQSQKPTQPKSPLQTQKPVQPKPASTAAPAVQKPIPAPAPTQSIPSVKPAVPAAKQSEADFDIDVPNFHRNAHSDNMSRADKVRMARENAIKTREDNQKTRVINVSEMTPELIDDLEKQKEEARRLVQQNQGKGDRFITKETKVAKSKPESKRKKSGPKKEENEFEETVGKGVLSNAVKAVIYIVSVLVISGCLALFAILVGNDCFAFVKTDNEAVITLEEGATLDDIARELKRNDIIKYPNMFKLYITIRGKDSDNYVAGSHTVRGTMGYDTLIAEFKPTAGREEVTITIVEGSTTQEIIDLFVENGIGTQKGFEETIKNHEFDYWFLDDLSSIDTSERIYRLDGYLFPDTYNFFTNATEAEALNKLLSNFETKFDIENKKRAEELGMTVDDIVILASMIQKEAMYVSDYPLVSSVFHNRIKDGMKLESNATVQYTMPKEEVELKLTYEQINTYDNGYNTYLYSGLPEGPICNASLNAINWAMYPNDTDYLYFVSDMEGYNHYAKTWAEHDKNVKTYQEEQ